MFYTSRFVFDGIPCEAHNVILCQFGDAGKQTNKLGVDIDIIEDRLQRNITPIHYGVNMNSALVFSITFGSLDYLDKYEVSEIASWLTGHTQYKWLELEQPDMSYLRYKCLINNMQEISVNGMAIGFSCDVVCDTQFAYSYEMEKEYTVNGRKDIVLVNTSTFNGYIYPTLTFSPSIATSEIGAINHSDQERECKISNLKYENNLSIMIDNKNQIISHNGSLNRNLYNDFSNKFFRLVKGENKITLVGSGTVVMKYTFLHNIGG